MCARERRVVKKRKEQEGRRRGSVVKDRVRRKKEQQAREAAGKEARNDTRQKHTIELVSASRTLCVLVLPSNQYIHTLTPCLCTGTADHQAFTGIGRGGGGRGPTRLKGQSTKATRPSMRERGTGPYSRESSLNKGLSPVTQQKPSGMGSWRTPMLYLYMSVMDRGRRSGGFLFG